jgi:hypothetical protein
MSLVAFSATLVDGYARDWELNTAYFNGDFVDWEIV